MSRREANRGREKFLEDFGEYIKRNPIKLGALGDDPGIVTAGIVGEVEGGAYDDSLGFKIDGLTLSRRETPGRKRGYVVEARINVTVYTWKLNLGSD